MRKLQILDWLEDLMEFGLDVVVAACGDWRRTMPDKRPTPGHIRMACLRLRPVSDRDALPPPADEADAHRMADEWAIGHGYMNIEHFQRENFTDCAVKLRGGRWLKFPGLREVKIERAPAAKFKSTAAALGVTAREYTPEEMTAGRAELGLL